MHMYIAKTGKTNSTLFHFCIRDSLNPLLFHRFTSEKKALHIGKASVTFLLKDSPFSDSLTTDIYCFALTDISYRLKEFLSILTRPPTTINYNFSQHKTYTSTLLLSDAFLLWLIGDEDTSNLHHRLFLTAWAYGSCMYR